MRAARAEAGQAVTAVAITTALIVVAAALGMIFSFGKGTSEMSKLKSGADAAALAGAQRVVNEAHGRIMSSLHSRSSHWNCGDGQARAASFASRNSTSLTSYCYFPLADRVEVTVRSTFVTETGRTESATSVAETGRRLATCIVVTIPGSLTGYQTTATCGDITVDVYVDSSGNATLLTPPGQIKDMFRVTLRE